MYNPLSINLLTNSIVDELKTLKENTVTIDQLDALIKKYENYSEICYLVKCTIQQGALNFLYEGVLFERQLDKIEPYQEADIFYKNNDKIENGFISSIDLIDDVDLIKEHIEKHHGTLYKNKIDNRNNIVDLLNVIKEHEIILATKKEMHD